MRVPDASRSREPAVSLPAFVIAAIGVMVAIHGIREFLPAEDDLRVLLDLSFVPARWSLALGHAGTEELIGAAGRGVDDPQLEGLREALARYLAADQSLRPWTCLSYALLHGSWGHVGLNAVWLAAFGTSVARRAGIGRSLLLCVAGALGGALAQWASDTLSVQPMIGASAVVSAFMGAAATFALGPPPPPWMRGVRPRRWAFLRNRSALVFLAVWLAGNLLFGFAAVPLGLSDAAVAWQAHIGGLLAGLLLFPYLDPGPTWSELRPGGA